MISVSESLARTALLACVLLAACKQAAPTAISAAGSHGDDVKPEQVEDKLDFVGQAEASKSVEVRSQVTGVIVARPYTEGTDVAQGTVLYRIDPTIVRGRASQCAGHARECAGAARECGA